MTVDELKILITAETAGLQKEIKQVKAQLGSMEKSVNASATKIKGAFKNLFAGISFTAIIYGLVRIGKTAIQVASDIQEVQNVVEVAFGSMASVVDRYAREATKTFGLSSLSFKKYASNLMAMSNGMGIIQAKGAEMSITLAGLAGDLASFYNTTSDVAFTALQGVFTGETEALKKFGVVMTEANLQAYALSIGITKSYNAMTQAEKVALRYAYVMSVTSQAQGDFARTSGSWANQVKLLSEQWKEFLGLIGNALITVLTPFVQLLNQILSFLITIGNAISKIFGGKGISGSTTSTTTSGLEDISGGLGNIEDGAGSADKELKKLQRTLMGFDELNTLNPVAEDLKDLGGSGGGLGGGSSTITVEPEISEEAEEGMLTEIEQFVQKAKEIIDKWISTIPELKFNFDKEQAIQDLENIGLDLINIIAGWGSLVVSIVVKVANDLDIGKLTNDILSLTEAFTSLASEITEIAVPSLQTFYDNVISPIVIEIGVILDNTLKDATQALNNLSTWVNENSEEITSFFEDLTIVISNFLEPLKNVLEFLTGQEGILTWLVNNILIPIGDWLLAHKDSLIDLFEYMAGYNFGNMIPGWDQINIFSGFIDLLERLGIVVDNGSDDIKNGTEEINKSTSGLLDKETPLWSKLLTNVSGFFTGFGKNKEDYEGDTDTIQGATETTTNIMENKWGNALVVCADQIIKFGINAVKAFNDLKTNVSAKWDEIKTNITNKVNTIKNEVNSKWTEMVNKLKNGFSQGVANVKISANDLYTTITSKIRSIYNTISPIVNTIKNLISGIISVAQNVASTVGGIVSNIWNSIRGVENAGNNVQVQVKTTTNTSGNRVGGGGGAISNRVVQVRANGGFVDRGQLFIANEAGPELVGRIGTQSAVANTSQIIEGIKQGVMSAIMETSFSSGKDQNINLYLDSQLVAKKVIKYHNDTVRQTGLSPLML